MISVTIACAVDSPDCLAGNNGLTDSYIGWNAIFLQMGPAYRYFCTVARRPDINICAITHFGAGFFDLFDFPGKSSKCSGPQCSRCADVNCRFLAVKPKVAVGSDSQWSLGNVAAIGRPAARAVGRR